MLGLLIFSFIHILLQKQQTAVHKTLKKEQKYHPPITKITTADIFFLYFSYIFLVFSPTHNFMLTFS